MANSSGSFGALLRGIGEASKKMKVRVIVKPAPKKRECSWTIKKVAFSQERMHLLEADKKLDPKKDLEGRMIRCVLITEGLGNKRDKNYYGTEALDSGKEVFEGASAFLNHPTEEEEEIIPERRVEAKCGYFKNLVREKYRDLKTKKMVEGLCGELHFDLSEAGECAYQKALTALHYREEFPDLPYEYVGLSVNADGVAERRTVEVDGEPMDVNYVLEFKRDASTSCDVVTSPARGGRFLAAMTEDEEGTIRVVLQEEPVKKKLKTALASARTALKASESEKDPKKQKSLLAEVDKKLKEAEGESENESESSEADILGLESFSKQENESEAEHKERLMKMGAALKKEMEAYASDGAESEGDGDGDADDAPPAKDKPAPKKDMESARLAVRHLISESGLDKKSFGPEEIERLAKLPLSEARREISREKRMLESVQKAVGGGRMKTNVERDVALSEGEHDDDRSDGSELFVASFSRRGGK